MTTATAEKRHRKRSAQYSAARSLAGREIGPLPPVRNPRRKAATWRSLATYATTYFPHTYTLPFSDDHREVIHGLETRITTGQLKAFGMPRGSGKSVLCDTATLWALSTGRVEFAALLGADEQAAIGHLETLKLELSTNDLLAEDWPEICYPIRCLEGIAQRAGGQLYRGRPTHLGWTKKRATLPFIPGSRAAAATVRVAGLTGSFRGMKFTRPDGRTVRPQLVVIDDPQTDESARSPAQCENRLGLLNGAVLGLAGPDRRISAVMPCTVIRPGDMADETLDSDKNPAWHGQRFPNSTGTAGSRWTPGPGSPGPSDFIPGNSPPYNTP
jgi:hypothetical protein